MLMGTEGRISFADVFFVCLSATVCTSPSCRNSYIYCYKHWAAEDWCADIVAQESQVVLMPGFDDPLVAAHLYEECLRALACYVLPFSRFDITCGVANLWTMYLPQKWPGFRRSFLPLGWMLCWPACLAAQHAGCVCVQGQHVLVDL